MINDVQYPEKFFNSISQYIYFNRLMLNMKNSYEIINQKYFDEELKINAWIDLIFGYLQWDQKPKKERLNLFGKYCYRQNINFDKILEKYKEKGYDDKKIINKIESKKARIINFGQCPEVLFKDKHKETILPTFSKEEEMRDEIEINLANDITINNFEAKTKKKFIIASFWLSEYEDNEYIYFLVFEKNNKNNENNSFIDYYILIYKNESETIAEPEYFIKIEEINLFNLKAKKSVIVDRINANDINQVNTFSSKDENNIHNERIYSNPIIIDIKNDNINLDKVKNDKDLAKTVNYNEKHNYERKYIDYIHYKISPKNCLFDICLSNKIYFFVGRNLDNSIKIYEIDTIKGNKGNKGKLKYNIPTENFVSCLHKKSNDLFFSGHKNGKLYEWKISYSLDKSKKGNIINIINRIELVRDLIAHKESMIICIKYIDKHNILLTSSNDGKLFIRKYYDFELLSVIEPNEKNCIIYQIIYTDFDLLYLSIHYKDKKYNYKSCISVYTLNGLLIESSPQEHFVDIESLKNGKIICNTIYSNNLNIFGLNNKLGTFNKYFILSKIELSKNNDKKDKNNKKYKNDKNEENDKNNKDNNKAIINFIFQHKKNCFYLLLDDNSLFKQQIPEFENLEKGVDKLNQLYGSKINDDKGIKSGDIFSNEKKSSQKRNGSM